MNLGEGVYVDGSWELSILVEDLQIHKKIRVSGDKHIGGVMLRLVELIDVKMDWSDHALWWPERNKWLVKTRHTLDQYGIQADAHLEYHRMHNFLRVQLPDLQEKELRVNYAQTVFGVIVNLCKDLGIRHPEELSFKKPDKALVSNNNNYSSATMRSIRSNSSSRFGSLRRSKSVTRSTESVLRSPNRRSDTFNPLVPKPIFTGSPYNTANGTLNNGRSPGSPSAINGTGIYNLMSPVSVNSLAFEGAEESLLANSPHVPTQVAFEDRGLPHPKSYVDRALLNSGWLDSSKSLMEQGIRPNDDELLLRFKYASYYDLNPKYDSIRINQIYEQAKWTLISEEIDCTEEEMLLLAALQFQAHLQSSVNQENDDIDGEATAEDEIDKALQDLELSLMSESYVINKSSNFSSPIKGSVNNNNSNSEIHHVPELTGYLKFFKPKKFTLKNYKKYYFVLKETTLFMYSDQGAVKTSSNEQFNLKNTEVTPDLNITTQKFGIKLYIHCNNGVMQEIWLRCENKDQYAQWMAAIHLASRGKTLASRALFESEVKETIAHLDMQAPKPQPLLTLASMPKIDPADYVSCRLLKKYKSKVLLQKILERHANVREKNLLEAKLDYIKTWQRLPGHGFSYFVVFYSERKNKALTFSEFRKERHQKEELLAVTSNRIMRLDIHTGDTLNTWRYNELDCWTINWEVLNLTINLNRPPFELTITPAAFQATKQSICKTLAEFIGGYVFLSLRKPDKSQDLNEQMFHKLTGSRDHLS